MRRDDAVAARSRTSRLGRRNGAKSAWEAIGMRAFETPQSYRDVASLRNAVTLLLYMLEIRPKGGLLAGNEKSGTSFRI